MIVMLSETPRQNQGSPQATQATGSSTTTSKKSGGKGRRGKVAPAKTTTTTGTPATLGQSPPPMPFAYAAGFTYTMSDVNVDASNIPPNAIATVVLYNGLHHFMPTRKLESSDRMAFDIDSMCGFAIQSLQASLDLQTAELNDTQEARIQEFHGITINLLEAFGQPT